MDAGAASWPMLGSLRIPLLAEATNVRAIVAVSILFRRRRVLGGHPANLCMSASRDDGVSALKGGCSCGGVASLERSAPAVAAPCRRGLYAFALEKGGIADEDSDGLKIRRRPDTEPPRIFSRSKQIRHFVVI